MHRAGRGGGLSHLDQEQRGQTSHPDAEVEATRGKVRAAVARGHWLLWWGTRTSLRISTHDGGQQ